MEKTMDIHELNEQRAKASQRVVLLGQMNQPTKPEDRLRADAEYQLAVDAYHRAEAEYRDALSRLSTADLQRLAGNA